MMFFDDNTFAGGGIRVESRRGSRNVKRHFVTMGQDRKRVGPDLVGGIPIGGNAVGSGNDGINPALSQNRGGG